MICLLGELEAECNVDLAHRIMAEKNGAFHTLLVCLKRFNIKHSVKDQCLKSLEALTRGYPDIVTHEGIEILCAVAEEVRAYIKILAPIVSDCDRFHCRTLP